MVLSGWKEIAEYLHRGVRTAQRWEGSGLPVNRPIPGRRSHVVANSEQLDLWLRYSADWRRHHVEFSSRIARTRKLRAEVRQTREILGQKMEALRREVTAVRAITEQLQRDHPNARNKKNARSAAA